MKTFIALIISVANYARDVLGRFSTITSSVSSVQSVVSSFAYANDELGRRTQRLDILPAAPFALTNTFGYNVRSEVVAAIMGANDHAYAYDPIGDLLAADLDGEGVFYSYDTNSNVTDLVDTKGDSVAHYEYGPFGETAAQKGSLVEVNPFHFSTKDLDVRVGLYFYGYRFLNPELGRWPNRDPIEELGGLSLYLFAGNQSVNLVDPLGLIGLGDLLQIGGSLQRVASNPLIRGSAIAGMLLSAADCLLNLAQLAQDPPDCVKTDVDQGVWIGECRDNTKDAVSSCSQLVGGIIGSIGGGAIGNLIGQIISRAAAELFNAVASDSLIDSIGGCDSPPDVDPCCGVGGNP